MTWMTHSGVVGTVQVEQASFLQVWQPKGWVEVAGPASDPGVRTVLTRGDIADGQIPVYDASTGVYVPQTPVAGNLPAAGTDGQVLVKDSSAPAGVRFADAPTATAGPPGPPGPPGKPGDTVTSTAGRWGFP
jgi:hypothetical protein